jgi:hypothetical protein
MNREKEIEQEVMKTLRCLDNIEEIEAGPFFYGCLQAKLENLNKPCENRLRQIFSRRLLRPAYIILLILINLVSAFVILQHAGNSTDTRTDNRKQNILAVAEEYSLSKVDYMSSLLQSQNR